MEHGYSSSVFRFLALTVAEDEYQTGYIYRNAFDTLFRRGIASENGASETGGDK